LTATSTLVKMSASGSFHAAVRRRLRRAMHDSQPEQRYAERFLTTVPFVGRERELVLLRHALDQALAGHGRVTLLGGEPGIGKTRAAEEFVAGARALGCQVHWSACDEWEGAPAYWPWTQVIRSIVRGRDSGSVGRLLGSDGSDIAQIVPELGVRQDTPALQPAGNEEAARFRLFDAVASFLATVAGETPIVVVLDDLHWADTPSLLLLQFVAQRLREVPLMILGTHRLGEVGREHPLAETLGELTRVQGSVRVILDGLRRDETREVATAVVGHELPARIIDVVQHETEGNPFFVTEIARYLAGERAMAPGATRGGLHFHVPETVKEVIGRRLSRLPAACQSLLSMASVVGREFSLRALAAIGERPVDEILEELDDALRARMIDAGVTPGAYRFHHALVQETLYELLPPSRRLRLHRAAGQALESLAPAGVDPPLDELSYHFFQAAPLGDAEKALDYAVRAAERAMALLAWENAVEHYRRALQAFDMAAEASALRKCELLLALGDAQALAERSNWGSAAARETFLRAADLARAAGSGEHLTRAALGFSGRNLVVAPSGERQVALLEEALARLGADDSALRVLALSRLAIDRSEIDLRQDPRLRLNQENPLRRLNDEAIAIARRIGDPAVISRALLAKHVVCSTHDNLDERIALATEGTEIARAAGDVELLWWGNAFLLWDYAELGDLEREQRALAAMIDATRMAPAPFREWGAYGQQAQVALREGRYAAAEEFASRAYGDLPLTYAPWHLFYLRREQGRLHEIEPALKGLTTLQTIWKNRDAMHALLAVELGWDNARALFDALAAGEFRDLPVTERLLNTLTLLTEACVGLGDRQRAERLYELLLPYANRPAAVLVHAIHVGAVSHYLGLLATLLERWDDGERHFEHALALNERLGLRPCAAHTRQAWADMLVKRGDTAGLDRARELNALAMTAAREIGMARLERMAESLASRLAVVKPPDPVPASTTAGLTGREAEVLRLIGAGKNNREIAEELFLSVRTVERHVENLYRKIEVRSRAEAIAFALRHAGN
jgi:ATP/maltotriose-dependent transcriptional regulator MalT